MKIAITTQGRTLDSTVADFSAFDGGLIIYDSDTLKFTYRNYSASPGPTSQNGIPFGKRLTDAGVDVLVVGEIAAQIARLLGSCGIKIYACIRATARDAINGLKLNNLQRIDSNAP